MRLDVAIGWFFANLIAFIVLTVIGLEIIKKTDDCLRWSAYGNTTELQQDSCILTARLYNYAFYFCAGPWTATCLLIYPFGKVVHREWFK